MKINGKISISRPQCGDGSKYIKIECVDDATGIRFFSGRIELDQFAEALTGMSFVNCDVEVAGLEHLGKVREHKTEVVPWNHIVLPLQKSIKSKREACAPFMNGGWIPHLDDLGNSHKFCGDFSKPAYSVHFYRYVEKPKQP